MSVIEYTLKHKALFVFLTVVLLIGGLASYFDLGRLEYPNFTIKKAVVATTYPGATAEQVEKLVTDKIEEEIQKMGQIDNITSISRDNLSIVHVEIKASHHAKEIPQIWDELRRKIRDVSPSLPAGAQTPKIVDDFGDVYGIFLSLSGKGYTFDDLKDYADVLKKEFLSIKDVAKVEFWGMPEKAVYVEFNRGILAQLGLSLNDIFASVNADNQVSLAGNVKVADEYPALIVSDEPDKVDALRNLFLTDRQGKLFRLGDVAKVYRGYREPFSQIMTHNGAPALGIGVSIVNGGNVVKLGNAVEAKLKQMQSRQPVGMDVDFINLQSRDVNKSVDDFMVNLIESVLIVVGILFLTMGGRSGTIIGLTLGLIMLGTFIGMKLSGIEMHIVSLGSLIVALGMLVDNAIVIVDAYLVKTAQGEEPEPALKSIVKTYQLPLLGATLIAIFAFAPVAFNPGNVGELCRSLFYVIAMSLLLSWVLAITITPLLCLFFIKPAKTGSESDVYGGKIYQAYRDSLIFCLKHKKASVLLLLAVLGVSGAAYPFVTQAFFPDSTRNQFYIDYWRAPASHIDETNADATAIADWLQKQDGVTETTVFTGEGALRFIMAYNYNDHNPAYAQILAQVDDYRKIPALLKASEKYIAEHYPQAMAQALSFTEGVNIPFKVAARFRGADKKVLRKLADKAKDLFRQNGNVKYIRDDWGDDVKALRVKYAPLKGRGAMVSRGELTQALSWNFYGVTVGTFRDGKDLIPIVTRAVESERDSARALDGVQVASATTGQTYNMRQVTDGIEVVPNPAIIAHRDRVPTITVQGSPIKGSPAALQKQLEKALTQIELPDGYSLEWGGEKEEKHKAEEAMIRMFPVAVLAMFLLMAMLFEHFRDAVVAIMSVPFISVGMVWGLIIANVPFGFMALVGFLGLSGMLLKNAIVMLDQINTEQSSGKPVFQSIVDAGVSRLRPVSMGAGTTILGVVPLITHAFYSSMAATIVFGLFVSTVLVLYTIPVFYAVLYRVKART